ncbi:MAG TPA: glycosyltransferase family 2 protein [Gammaproteobacteria bacterium]|nr:glycosyltransferase family 2 protein [Gammaproteobacteria bacterium]
MTKLVIQIPCYNEADDLPATLACLPRRVAGFDEVEWLVVDDGSDDGTARVAADHGVDHVVSLVGHQGLARAFTAALEAALEAGADVIVNTDADNQYQAEDIPRLAAPIREGRADMVIGERPITDSAHMSPTVKRLQRLGSWFIRVLSRTSVPDAPSGFRAFSRKAAMQLNVFSEYTYTLETIIQAGHKNIAVATVPVRTNGPGRPSRLMKGLPDYILQSVVTAIRIFVTYRPLRFFFALGGAVFLLGFALGVRFLVYYFEGAGDGHVQSLILAALLMGMGFLVGVVGVLADLIAVNRKLLEKVDFHTQRVEEHLSRGRGDAGEPHQAPGEIPEKDREGAP